MVVSFKRVVATRCRVRVAPRVSVTRVCWTKKVIEIRGQVVVDINVADVWRVDLSSTDVIVLLPRVVVEQHVADVVPQSKHQLLEVDAFRGPN